MRETEVIKERITKSEMCVLLLEASFMEIKTFAFIGQGLSLSPGQSHIILSQEGKMVLENKTGAVAASDSPGPLQALPDVSSSGQAAVQHRYIHYSSG